MVNPVSQLFDSHKAWGFVAVAQADGWEGQAVAGCLLVDFSLAQTQVFAADCFQWDQGGFVAGH